MCGPSCPTDGAYQGSITAKQLFVVEYIVPICSRLKTWAVIHRSDETIVGTRTHARWLATEPRCAGLVALPMGHVALFVSTMRALVGIR